MAAQKNNKIPSSRNIQASLTSDVPACSSLRDFATLISSAHTSAHDGCTPDWPLSWAKEEAGMGKTYGNHFTWCGSSVNSALAKVAELEADGKLSCDSLEGGITDFLVSPMYWRLRQAFVEEVEHGGIYAFFNCVWRAYTAGRLDPSRIESDSLS